MDVWIIEIMDSGKWKPLGSCFYLTFEEAENDKINLNLITAQWGGDEVKKRIRKYRRM